MAKETIQVVLPMKTYDTSKMDTWTQKQWQEFVGEEKDHTGIQLLLINDNNLYLKIMAIYFNETSEEMFFSFDVQNKLDRPIQLQFNEWTIDGIIYNLSHEKPQYLERFSEITGFQKCVKRTYLEEWNKTTIHINILDAETATLIRSLEFQINKQITQVF